MIIEEKWHHLRKQAEKANARFIRCDGVTYEVTRTSYPNGPSPLWSIDEVVPVDVQAFIPVVEHVQQSFS